MKQGRPAWDMEAVQAVNQWMEKSLYLPLAFSLYLSVKYIKLYIHTKGNLIFWILEIGVWEEKIQLAKEILTNLFNRGRVLTVRTQSNQSSVKPQGCSKWLSWLRLLVNHSLFKEEMVWKVFLGITQGGSLSTRKFLGSRLWDGDLCEGNFWELLLSSIW